MASHKLTELGIRKAKAGKKDKKLFDGKGLFLLVTTKGRKYWRLKYRYNKKEKLLSFGVWPEISLIEAREKGIVPFCLTVDKSGHDYLKVMMDDFNYEVLPDISQLPIRLPQLYKNLTT